MNEYKVKYEYTEPTEDTPYCKVSGHLITEAESEAEAKQDVTDRVLFSNYENFKITGVFLLRENSEKLERLNGEIKAFAGSFSFMGNEIVICARDEFNLSEAFKKLCGSEKALSLPHCHNVLIKKDPND
ncbi:hypothetical protein [Pseudoalteromonas phage C7]|uniref:hypothetical protein n=1 Tax=Pseudoalteromonas phage C7 TaxID=2510494 RepID=UPI001018789F|nr:hypothetical protein PP587_gp38 [Pseudoalteromonas phage C7]QAY17992.1 hypothetical protein [Pseudoalteromonas phage C7]